VQTSDERGGGEYAGVNLPARLALELRRVRARDPYDVLLVHY
jgi:hypothetical protein